MSLIKDRDNTVLEPLSTFKEIGRGEEFTYHIVTYPLDVVTLREHLLDFTVESLMNMDDVYSSVVDTYLYIEELFKDPSNYSFVKMDSKGDVKGVIIMGECTSIHHLHFYGTYVNYNVEGDYKEFYKCVRSYLKDYGVTTIMVSKRSGNSYINRFINL